MTDPVPFKPKDDYSHLIIRREIDGEVVEYVGIDEMTEDQFKKYCRDTGSEWFQRTTIVQAIPKP